MMMSMHDLEVEGKCRGISWRGKELIGTLGEALAKCQPGLDVTCERRELPSANCPASCELPACHTVESAGEEACRFGKEAKRVYWNPGFLTSRRGC